MDEKLKEALLWEQDQMQTVKCRLCNWRCTIANGKLGHCRVRKNIGGRLYSLNYDKVCAANADPIEKKPLFHFQPGSKAFSIAAVGCNFQCEFCQNWQISQMVLESAQLEGQAVEPEAIVQSALHSKCSSIAYTYTEPTIFMELCRDCAIPAKAAGLKNVFVSNGYMTIEAIDFARDWLDAINVDLKSFSEMYYHKLCKAHLKPVLDTISHIAKNTNIWMEITTLLIPGENDSEEELKQLADWLVNSAGPDYPWHVSRFYPNYHYLDSEPTPSESLERAFRIGKAAGLKYIYVGNMPGDKHENTFCPGCGELLIERRGYSILRNSVKDSVCPDCSQRIAGIF